MKKLTKLTALALALALALGMTVMAAPSEVIKTVDFTGYTDLSAATVISFADASAASKISFNKGDSFTFGEGSLAYDKVYYQAAATNPNWGYVTVTPINGVNTIGINAAMWANGGQNPNQVGITFPEAWEYSEDYALVAEMSMIADARAKGDSNYHYQNHANPGFGALLSEAGADAASETNVIRTVAGWGFRDDYQALLRTTNGSSNSMAFAAVAPRSVVSKQTAVIRPYARTAEYPGLDIISGFDKMPTYNAYQIAEAAGITKVHGLFNTFPGYEKWGYTGYRLYKVSLNPADFTITSAKSFADLEVTDSIKIAFSQPITTNVAGGNGSYDDVNLVTLENALTITPAGGEALVYGEDYTISIAEKADGTGIYDELTITPVNPWAFGTDYTIGLPTGLKNIARVDYADATEDETTVDTVAFSTVAAPAFDMTLTAYKGLAAAGAALEALEDGTTYFAVTAAYNSGKVVANGTIRLEILDADGNVVKYVANKKDLTSAVSFGVSFKVEEGYTARVSIDGGVIGGATID